MWVVVSPQYVCQIADPNVTRKGNLHPKASQVKFTPAEFRAEGSGEDRDLAILDLHLSDLKKLLELIQIFQVLLMLRRGASEGVETLLECDKLPGLGRDPSGVLLEVLLGEAHLLLQEGGLFLEATSTLPEISLPDSALPLSAPRDRGLLRLVPQNREGILEGFHAERREGAELREDLRET
jgi:hypothetical protein